ncbi:PIN domain-containing protein [Microbacterium sp.]|uniref:PIN domain-containing protein n=1 Tax=Microbacterium sp. TaxID=51671 RepID=UPI0031FF04DE|nr:PIN domain-containing protein [Microbacterium sp.]
MARTVIILDTNTFWGDVFARRPRLSAVFAGAANGDYELVIPSVVYRELCRQFPERVDSLLRRSTKAMKPLVAEYGALGIDQPEVPVLDVDQLARDYVAALDERLRSSGVRVVDPPLVDTLVEWAIHRRKPFKQSGAGLQDSLIWLTALNEASNADEVVLVTENTSDFGDDGDPPSLAPELGQDLIDRGVPAERVRLVATLESLVSAIVAPLGQVDARAVRILSDEELAGRLTSALEAGLLYTRMPQDDLELGAPLDEDPQVTGVVIEGVELISARQLERDQLLLELSVFASVTLEALLFKGDYYVLASDTPLRLTDPDFNDHYLEAESELTVRLVVEVATDAAVTRPELTLTQAALAEPNELADLRLQDSRGDAFLQAVAELSAGVAVSPYLPETHLDSNIENATLGTFASERAELEDAESLAGTFAIECTVLVHGRGDIDWTSTAPSGRDLEALGPYVEGGETGAGWINARTESEPIIVLVHAISDLDGWHELEVEAATLEASALRGRQGERGSDSSPDSSLEDAQETK